MQVFTSVIVTGIFFAVFIYTDVKDYKRRKVNSMKGLAHVIGTNSIPSLQFQDNESARDLLAELRNSTPDITHAVITDKNGISFASYTRPGVDSSGFAPELFGKTSIYGKKAFFIISDINNNGEFLGRVALQAELTELDEIKSDRYEMAAILFFGALGFSFIIAITVQPYISNRLLYVVKTMKEAGDTGNYDVTINDKGKDEINVLIRVFNKLMQDVRESQQKKDEFIGIASHELKTPLTSIKGYLELLDSMEDRQPNKQFAGKALDNVNKLERLIKDLLDVSKIQTGQLQLEIEDFDMDKLLDEAISSMQMVSPIHTITREGDLGGLIVSADRQRIEQVMQNLLSNAIKYSPGEKKVIVSSKRDANLLTIRVRDYGIGIAGDELMEIFERFYRTKGLSVHISGFGLGLYICRDIIQRHHGKIWAEREEKGTSFYFTLPLKKTIGSKA